MSEAALVQWKIDTSKVEGYLPEKGDAVVAALMERVNSVNSKLVKKIVGEKLSGDPLKSHTHKLAGSIRANPAENDGAKILGTVQGGGGPAFYAKYHEFGGTFDVPGGRRVALGSKASRVELALEAKRGGYDFMTHVQSKPYTITFPERSFMRSTLAENKENILTSMQDAVTEAVK